MTLADVLALAKIGCPFQLEFELPFESCCVFI